jgi:hypothetical protein
MASDGIHYLVVFDDHSERPIYLGRQHRIATADQRIVCYSRDGGCTRPNCLEPGYHSEVHHSPDWAAGGATDADTLFFACAPDHSLATNGHQQTTVTDSGRLAWTDGTKPPENQPRPPPRRTPTRRHRPTRQPTGMTRTALRTLTPNASAATRVPNAAG